MFQLFTSRRLLDRSDGEFPLGVVAVILEIVAGGAEAAVEGADIAGGGVLSGHAGHHEMAIGAGRDSELEFPVHDDCSGKGLSGLVVDRTFDLTGILGECLRGRTVKYKLPEKELF